MRRDRQKRFEEEPECIPYEWPRWPPPGTFDIPYPFPVPQTILLFSGTRLITIHFFNHF